MKARKLAQLNGRAVYLFPVVVTDGEQAAMQQANIYNRQTVPVIAETARDAADLIQAEHWGEPCISVEVYGPRGGIACKRWQGFESAIGQQMFRARWPETLALPL